MVDDKEFVGNLEGETLREIESERLKERWRERKKYAFTWLI